MREKKPKKTPVSAEAEVEAAPSFSIDAADIPVDVAGNSADAGKKIAEALAPFRTFDANALLSRKK